MELIDRGCQDTSTFVVYRPKSKAHTNAALRFFSRVVAAFGSRLIEREPRSQTYAEEIVEKRAMYQAEHHTRFL